MNTRAAEAVANAVLYEGYVLYPYRASAPKNRMRWQVGLAVPRDFAEATAADPWFMQAECLAEVGQDAALTLRVRCLHLQERIVQESDASDRRRWRALDKLVVGDRQFVTWDEAVPREFVRECLPVLWDTPEQTWSWTLEEALEVEYVDAGNRVASARVVRHRRPVTATVRLAIESHPPLVRIRIRIENVTLCAARTIAERDAAVRESLAGTHAILGIENGAFVSALDPPSRWAGLAASCCNHHLFPVLAGTAGARDLILASPIILYDYPAIAPESRGDLCDGTEIDELLTLRVRTLTEDEKREARATDTRAARIVDQCEAAEPGAIARLHGTIRSFESMLNPADEPSPDAASIKIGGITVKRGSQVSLQPTRMSDSLDLCLRGRRGTVTAVYRTLEGQPYVAVGLDDDPFSDEGAKFRRSLFFHPEELIPVGGDQ